MPAIFHDVFNRKTIRRGIFFVAIYSYHFVDKIFQKISLEGDIAQPDWFRPTGGPSSPLPLPDLSALTHLTAAQRWEMSGGAWCLMSDHLSSWSDLSSLSLRVRNWTLGVPRPVSGIDWDWKRWLFTSLISRRYLLTIAETWVGKIYYWLSNNFFSSIYQSYLLGEEIEF